MTLLDIFLLLLYVFVIIAVACYLFKSLDKENKIKDVIQELDSWRRR